MAKNGNLHDARAAKNNEFYTQYQTISDEMSHYRDHFNGKVVYCNCDDPTWSNFWRYFHNNFASLGLKKLIATHYVKDSEPSYMIEYSGGNDFDMEAGKVTTIYGNGRFTAGDFRSQKCVELLDEADIVVTNPPFSEFTTRIDKKTGEELLGYLEILIRHDKKFIILGNQNMCTHKNTFPLIKDNKVWYGASIHSGGVDFRMPDDYEEYSPNVFMKNGHHYINLAGIRWFTNLDIQYRHDGLWHRNGEFDKTKAHCYYEGFEDKYPKYDNYDAIEVSKTKDIPIDYPGVMGVPITWLDKYSPEEFEILGQTNSGDTSSETESLRLDPSHRHGALVNGKEKYMRILIRNLHPIPRSEDIGY